VNRIIARTYAILALAHAAFLAATGVYMLRYGGHGGPAGLPLLILSAALVALSPFIWLGHRWAAVVTLADSFFPGVWPVLWSQFTGAWKFPAAQPTIVIAGHRFFLPWWEIVFLAAPVSFAALTVLLVFATKSASEVTHR
jgi:hypothetical protein